jgi:acyl-CoA reductase-like NAD-dependent aldehyde dehydrogenase
MTLIKDHRIALVSFTGSPEVGWNLRKEIHPGTRICLELGGNAGLVVHDDADLELAAKAACRGGYAHSGQTCISVQRVYVQSKVYDKFVKIFTDMVNALKVVNRQRILLEDFGMDGRCRQKWCQSFDRWKDKRKQQPRRSDCSN